MANDSGWSALSSGSTGDPYGAQDPSQFTEYQAPAAAGAGMSGGGTGAAIGAGLGLLQAIGAQNAYQAKMRQLATTTRFSPWTKMSMAQPNSPNALSPISGLAASGATLGQSLASGVPANNNGGFTPQQLAQLQQMNAGNS